MILGVDHLHIAVPDAAEAEALLESLGYRKEFEQRDIFSGGEDPLLYGGRGKDIAYYRADDGALAVELINSGHGSTDGGGKTLRSLLSNAVRGDVAIASADLERSERFWRGGLGFRDVEGGETGARLLGLEGNMFGPGIRVLLEESPRLHGGFEFVDDPGCVALAFLSTGLEGDMPRLLAHGARAHGEQVGMRINGRELRAWFAVGPCGEHVELIEFGRAATERSD